MKDNTIGVYDEEVLRGVVELGTLLTPVSGMPWGGAYNPRPVAPFLHNARKNGAWRSVRNKIWVRKEGNGLRVIQVGGEELLPVSVE